MQLHLAFFFTYLPALPTFFIEFFAAHGHRHSLEVKVNLRHQVNFCL